MLLSDAINFRIRELLRENNLTAYKLSYRAGISNSIISDCKRGVRFIFYFLLSLQCLKYNLL